MYHSRLKKQEESKVVKQIVSYICLTLGLIVLFFLIGLPFLIRFSIFLGGLKSSTALVEERKDTIAPPVPTINPLPEATNKTQIKISGNTEVNSEVTLVFNNERVAKIKANEGGEFVSEELNLKNGENKISAFATDEEGNKSEFSEPIFITYKSEAPILEIFMPQSGEIFYGSKKEAIVSGKTENDNRVFINDVSTIVDLNGEFNKAVGLNEGENNIKIKVVDKAENTSEKEIKVSYYP